MFRKLSKMITKNNVTDAAIVTLWGYGLWNREKIMEDIAKGEIKSFEKWHAEELRQAQETDASNGNSEEMKKMREKFKKQLEHAWRPGQ